jgi:hypothetical protein
MIFQGAFAMNLSPPSPPAVASDTRQSYKVFVSSTFLDNQERRRLVQDAITMAGMVWHGMEIFTASTRPTVEECLRYVRDAEPGSSLSERKCDQEDTYAQGTGFKGFWPLSPVQSQHKHGGRDSLYHATGHALFHPRVVV